MLKKNEALDINKSVWINACAGSGKTTLLVDRIIKLLLNKQQNILCLAFTNIAALEMYQRIWFKLNSWSTQDYLSLKKEIENYILFPTDAVIEYAQSLCFKFQDYVQISTVHAFCLNILKQYSGLENGDISILEDTPSLYYKAVHYVLENFKFENSTNISESKLINYVLTFFNYYKEALEDVHYIQHLEKKIRETHKSLPQITCDDLKGIICILEKGSIREIKYAELLKKKEWSKVFLDSKNQVKSLDQIVTKKTIQLHPQLLKLLANLQVIFLENEENISKKNIYNQTYALVPLLKQVYFRYQELKGRAISYDEVINITLKLLEEQLWILLEIDKNLDHLLIDESQDNNPMQWLVIKKITSEFFVGEGSRLINRTMFVIGDVKQCIYGFQKASPALFKLIQSSYINLPQWCFINSNITYRNSVSIIELVKSLYSYFASIGSTEDYKIVRQNTTGKVEIWPLFTTDDKNSDNVEKVAAYGIIKKIADWLKEGKILASKNRLLQLSDILILVRHRTKFVDFIIEAAQAHNLPIVREDNFNALTTPLGKLLINLIEAVLLPEDDLTLVKILRSPIFSFEESEIFNLAHDRKEVDIFSRLKDNFPTEYAIIKEWQLISEPSLLYITVLSTELIAELTSIFGEDTTFIADAFIEAAFNFNTLSTFLSWCQENTLKVKKPVFNHGMLRINTIHGAKGTEAPIVFIADTTVTPRLHNFNLIEMEGFPLFMANSLPRDFIVHKEMAVDEIYKEYLRLLYVAITRAEDELYIIGTKKAQKGSWYSLIYEASAKMEKFVTQQDNKVYV